jgi:hypothetical protein
LLSAFTEARPAKRQIQGPRLECFCQKLANGKARREATGVQGGDRGKEGQGGESEISDDQASQESELRLATRRGGPHGYCGFFELRAFTGIDMLTSIVVLEAVSDWLRQWQAIDFAESGGYGRANDIDK